MKKSRSSTYFLFLLNNYLISGLYEKSPVWFQQSSNVLAFAFLSEPSTPNIISVTPASSPRSAALSLSSTKKIVGVKKLSGSAVSRASISESLSLLF